MKEYPRLSLRERDRRWAKVRTMMKAEGVDVLAVFGRFSREPYEAYLSHELCDGIVVLPSDRDPIYLVGHIGRISRRMEADMPLEEFWIADMRPGADADGFARTLSELGCAEGRVGIVGLKTEGAGGPDGNIPHTLWEKVLARLPRAEFVEVSVPFQRLMLVKSAEELDVVRFCAHIGEKACEAIVERMKVGVLDSDIYAAAMHVIHSHRAITVNPILVVGIAPETLGWGPPSWWASGGPPHVVQRGDVLQAELLLSYAGLETQPQLMVAVEPVAEIYQEIGPLAERCHDAAIEALKPGARFGDVCEAMESRIRQSDGCWTSGPVMHTLSPHWWRGMMLLNGDRIPKVAPYVKTANLPGIGYDNIVEPGMVFAIEPSPGKLNARAHVGSTVILGSAGPEVLNKIGTRVQYVS